MLKDHKIRISVAGLKSYREMLTSLWQCVMRVVQFFVGSFAHSTLLNGLSQSDYLLIALPHPGCINLDLLLALPHVLSATNRDGAA